MRMTGHEVFRWLGWVLCAGLVLAAGPVSAQVQRNFINLGFEAPNLATAGCRVYIAASQVPGWETTHTSHVTENSGDCVVPSGFDQTAPILEIWHTPRSSTSGGTVNARGGVQLAELNAAAASRIYQNVCLINGESVRWRFSHRGRAPGTASSTSFDRMEMKVGATNTVVRVGTTNNGTFETPVVSQGSAQTPVRAPGNTTWVDYSGQFQYAGTTGSTNIGFEAVGGTTEGNLLDEIQIAVAPFVEFITSSSSTPEASSSNLPTFRVNGTVYSAFNVTVRIAGGTAVLGTDFVMAPGTVVDANGDFTITVPAGNYDGTAATNSLFQLPVVITNDTVAEGNETIIFQLRPSANVSATDYLLVSSSQCGAPGLTTWTYTIVDDDADLVVTKNADEPVAVVAQGNDVFEIVYTIGVNNPTAVAATYSLIDAPGFASNVSILQAGFTRNGAASVALAGVGPWTLQAAPGSTLAAGGTDTYRITVRFRVQRGGMMANNACASPLAPGAGLYNRAVATLHGQADRDFQSEVCRSTPVPVWVELIKRLQGRANAADQVQVRLYSRGIQHSTATTTGTALPAVASTGVVILPAGYTMQFTETVKANGTGADQPLSNYLPSLQCVNNTQGSTTPLPSGTGSPNGNTQAWNEFTPTAGDDLTCTITNAPGSVDLSITKTTPASTVTSGSTVIYSIVASNNGTATAFNARVTDPPLPGLSCTNVTCAASGTATCPSAVDVAGLQGAGLIIPVLPTGQNVTFTLTCSVAATGTGP